jgi:hypothetical protein
MGTFVGLSVLAALLSVAAWVFWTWMLWTIMVASQQQSNTLMGILAELRLAKLRAAGAGEAEPREEPVPPPPPRTRKAEAAAEDAAMGFLTEGTGPNPRGLR